MKDQESVERKPDLAVLTTECLATEADGESGVATCVDCGKLSMMIDLHLCTQIRKRERERIRTTVTSHMDTLQRTYQQLECELDEARRLLSLLDRKGEALKSIVNALRELVEMGSVINTQDTSAGRGDNNHTQE